MDPATSFPYTPVIDAAGRGRQGPGLAERPDALPQPRELDLHRGVDDVRRLLRPGRPHDREPGGRGRLRGRLQPVGRPGRRRLPHRHRQARELRVLAEVHDRGPRPRGVRSATPDFFMFGEVYDADPAKLVAVPARQRHERGPRLHVPVGGRELRQGRLGGAACRRCTRATTCTRRRRRTRRRCPRSSATTTWAASATSSRTRTTPEQRSELAHSLMYLTRGQPVVYYGDEQGFVGHVGDGTDKDARQSLFATQVAEYANQHAARRDDRGLGRPVRHRLGAVRAHRRARRPAQRQPGAAATAPRSSGTPTAPSTRSRRVDATEKVEHLVALNNGTAAGDGHDRHADAGRDVRAAVRDVDERDGGRRRHRLA